MSKISNSERLGRLVSRYPSEAKLQMLRNLCFGAAGTSLLILLVIFQSGEESLALKIAQLGGAASLPFWFTMAGMLESYILIGPRSYSHYRKKAATTYFPSLFVLGGAASIASIGGVLYQLESAVLYVFIASIIFCIIVAIYQHNDLANDIFGEPEQQDKS